MYHYLNVYEVTRYYGGPEEGGWWFDAGEPVASIPFETEHETLLAIDEWKAKFPNNGNRFSVRPQAIDYYVLREDHFAEAWPKERPRYE